MSLGIAGHYMSGKTSLAIPAKLHLEGKEIIVFDQDQNQLVRANLHEIIISDRLGNIPRKVSFPDSSHFETKENDLFEKQLLLHGKSGSLLHRLEGKLHYIILSILLTVMSVLAFLMVGLPYASVIVANGLPSDLLDQASKSTLYTMDKFALGPSRLSQQRQDEINTMVRNSMPKNEHNYYRILFRQGKELGANAFALPDGSIIFTDELIELLESEEEIFAVFAHELGHVVERHSLRQILQSSVLLIFSYLVIGEATDGVLELTNALPALLMSSSYSRKFESEADDFAIALLKKLKIPAYHLGDALEKLSHSHSEADGIKYLQTHPPTEERIRKSRQ